MEKEYISKEKKQELESELHDRKTTQRDQIGERVSSARALGDLSENAEYQAARAEQRKNESRITYIEQLLKRAEIITRTATDRIELGATVVVQKDNEEPKTFHIVSHAESDITVNKISTTSPIGSALLGKKSGESFVVTTPRGDTLYTIVSVQ